MSEIRYSLFVIRYTRKEERERKGRGGGREGRRGEEGKDVRFRRSVRLLDMHLRRMRSLALVVGGLLRLQGGLSITKPNPTQIASNQQSKQFFKKIIKIDVISFTK